MRMSRRVGGAVTQRWKRYYVGAIVQTGGTNEYLGRWGATEKNYYVLSSAYTPNKIAHTFTISSPITVASAYAADDGKIGLNDVLNKFMTGYYSFDHFLSTSEKTAMKTNATYITKGTLYYPKRYEWVSASNYNFYGFIYSFDLTQHGDYVDDVVALPGTYPNNGIQGDYWYILQ